MISIRKITEEDIPNIVLLNQHYNMEFLGNYLDNKEQFIEKLYNNHNRLFTIVDDKDDNKFIGNVYLYGIDPDKLEASYSMFVAPNETSTEIEKAATNRLLMFAFQELGLKKVYLNINNKPFINENNGFDISNNNVVSIERKNFIESFKKNEEDMTNVKRRYFKEITDNRGDLIALENPRQLEFPLNRVYYMYNVGEGIVRGRHSHYNLEQMLICVSGCVTVITKTPYEEKEYILDKPYEGLYIGPMIWREMINFSPDSVLVVLASRKYDEEDYIRDYEIYEEEAKKYFIKR